MINIARSLECTMIVLFVLFAGCAVLCWLTGHLIESTRLKLERTKGPKRKARRST